MKNVTGQLVTKAKYNPNQTPARDKPTDTIINFGTECTKYLAVAPGRVSNTKTNIEPTICDPMLTLSANVIKKATDKNLVLRPAARAPI